MRYTVTCAVSKREPDGWARARQVPMFGLPDAGNSLEMTADIAQSVVDPFSVMSVYVMVWDNDTQTGYRKDFR